MVFSTGGLLSAGTFWVANSRRRSARMLRQIFADSRRKIQAAPEKPRPNTWSDNAVTLAWLGHSTVLVNFYGIKFITDPAFGARIGVGLGVGTAGPKRYVACALKFSELPPLDFVLLSHAHMDHMDLPSLTRFAQTTPVIPAALTSDILRCTGLKKIREMRWDDKHRVQTDRGDIEIEAVEVNHWGRRWPNEKIDRGYNGYIIRRERKALLFAGDTARTTLFADLCARGPFEAAVMPIGAYNPWIRSHCTPEQAVEMANAAGAKYFVPVHHQTFKLSDESMSEPIERLQKALSDEPDRIALRRVGETVVSPNA